MAVLSAAVALPLLALARSRRSSARSRRSLLRSVLIRLPLALLFTGVSVQLVALGLGRPTRRARCLIGADGDPTHQMLSGLVGGACPAGKLRAGGVRRLPGRR